MIEGGTFQNVAAFLLDYTSHPKRFQSSYHALVQFSKFPIEVLRVLKVPFVCYEKQVSTILYI
jgi:hypothetical protein